MWQVGVSNSVDCCRVVGWWTPIFLFFFVCPSSESGWDGRVVWWSVSLSSGLWMGRAFLVFLPDSGESRLEW